MKRKTTKTEDKQRTFSQNFIASIYENVSMFAVGIVAVMLIFTFGFKVSAVEGESMLPTLENGDRVVITACEGEPKAGQVIISVQPNWFGKPVVKRIIALENQTVDIDFEKGSVYVDDELLNEPYINNLTVNCDDVTFPLTVPEGCVFVMGDNRQGSTDSRSTKIGFIKKEYILGVVKYRIINIKNDTDKVKVSLIDFENMKIN